VVLDSSGEGHFSAVVSSERKESDEEVAVVS
jgi:hypothetical protein